MVKITVVIIILLAAALVSGVDYFRRRNKNHKRILLKADKAFGKGKIDKSRKYYEKIIKKLKDASPDKKKDLLGRAYLGLGRAYKAKDDTYGAATHYKRALRSLASSEIPDDALIILGTALAKDNDDSVKAIDIYLRTIRMNTCSEDTEKIYTVLEGLCFMEEPGGGGGVVDQGKVDGIKRLIELNERVITARSGLEWAHYYAGLGYFIEENYTKAISSFKKSIDIDPQKFAAYYWLIKGLLKLNAEEDRSSEIFENADKLFSIAAKKERETIRQGEIYYELGNLVLNDAGCGSEEINFIDRRNSEKLHQAIAYYREALGRDGRNAEYLFVLGRACSLAGDSSEALKAFSGAAECRPDKKEYLYYLAKEYYAADRLDESAGNLEKALLLDDTYVDAHALLSRVYLLKEKYAESEIHALAWINAEGYSLKNLAILISALYCQRKYENVIETAGHFLPLNPFENVTETVMEAIYYVARSYLLGGEYEKAVECFSKLAGLSNVSRNIYYYGCALANKGEYRGAELEFNKLAKSGNDYIADALIQRGHIYLKTGRRPEAESDYKKAYEIKPADPEASYALAVFYYNEGDNDKAEVWFSKAMETDPSDGRFCMGMGLVREKRGELDEAVSEYERALRNGLASHLVRTRLGVISCRKSGYKKALEHFEHIDGPDANSYPVMFYKGLALLHCGQEGKAIEVWTKLHALYPDDTRLMLNICRAHYLLGCRHIREGNLSGAVSEWEKYLEVYSTDEKTGKDLAQLYFRMGIEEISNGFSEGTGKAKRLIESALRLDESNPVYLYYAALCDLETGMYDECIERLNGLVELMTDGARVKYHIGVALMRKGEKEKAVDILREIAGVEEKDVYADNAVWIIANEFISEGRYKDAINMLGRLL